MERARLPKVRSHVKASVSIVVLAATALAQQPSPMDSALQDLASQDALTSERGLAALLAQSGVNVQGANGTRVRVANLLHNHPEHAERVRAALISALERRGAEFEAHVRDGQTPSVEALAEPLLPLTGAVAALQDPRAVAGLILALPFGSIEGLADICPAAVDAIVQRIHKPDLDSQGVTMGLRRQAITALGWCLQRPAMMRGNPDVEAKIRSELLADLDDPDWSIRSHAVDALIPLRADPEVRAKLQAVAATDPYVTSEFSPPGKPAARFIVRDGTSSILGSDAFSFYLTRTPETRSCRIQPASETPIGQQIIGPETQNFVKRMMCSHYDPTGVDPQSCWLVEPVNACTQ